MLSGLCVYPKYSTLPLHIIQADVALVSRAEIAFQSCLCATTFDDTALFSSSIKLLIKWDTNVIHGIHHEWRSNNRVNERSKCLFFARKRLYVQILCLQKDLGS